MTRKLSLHDARQLAIANSGLLLSTSMPSIKEPLTWMCSESHEFTRSVFDVKYMKYWCPVCKGRHTNQDYLDWSKKIDATLLGVERINGHKKLKLQCKADHIWLASPSHVKNGSRCPECSGRKKLSIDACRKHAASKSGRCLSEEYKNAHNKLHWECSEGHRWYAKFGSMRHNDAWCPTCASISSRRWSIEDAVKLAESNKGSFLSDSFSNRGSRYEWRCKNRHQFTMEFDAVLKGRWCPKCKFKKESKVREIAESITGHAFPQRGPSWLKNPKTGGRLKFDAFNDELNIAIEYHGEFHYRANPWNSSLEEIKYRDSLKKRLAKKHGVVLIIVPYIVKNIEAFLTKRLS